MIHFDEIKNKIIDTIDRLANEGNTYYLIRDVFGRISVYILGDDDCENIKKDIAIDIDQE